MKTREFLKYCLLTSNSVSESILDNDSSEHSHIELDGYESDKTPLPSEYCRSDSGIYAKKKPYNFSDSSIILGKLPQNF